MLGKKIYGISDLFFYNRLTENGFSPGVTIEVHHPDEATRTTS